MLESNIETLQDKSSFLGCKRKCESSRLSMSIHYLLLYLDRSGLAPEEMQEFKYIAELGVSFFSGISTKFFKCKICGELRYCVEEKPVICKDCIKAVCVKQLEDVPMEIFYNSSISEEEFAENDYLGENYFLAEYDPYKKCYKFTTESDGVKNMHKVAKINSVYVDEKVVLARGIELRQQDNRYFYIEQHSDLQHICLLSFYYLDS